jgi:hypothetical protein
MAVDLCGAGACAAWLSVLFVYSLTWILVYAHVMWPCASVQISLRIIWLSLAMSIKDQVFGYPKPRWQGALLLVVFSNEQKGLGLWMPWTQRVCSEETRSGFDRRMRSRMDIKFIIM